MLKKIWFLGLFSTECWAKGCFRDGGLAICDIVFGKRRIDMKTAWGLGTEQRISIRVNKNITLNNILNQKKRNDKT